ncbi:unnamed protein product [Rotaria sp. Silwood1]|nr:unnamed protein product [Rotaria sp. Silwood1]
MNDILCIVKTTSQIKNGSWVRVEHGIYPDDLAKVEYCDMIQNMVTFKLIPRIDYTKKTAASGRAKRDNEYKKKIITMNNLSEDE